MRAATAHAIAPELGGRNSNATLYLSDGTSGTLDPAFPAHILPLYTWALAWKQQWVPRTDLVKPAGMVVQRMAHAKTSVGDGDWTHCGDVHVGMED